MWEHTPVDPVWGKLTGLGALIILPENYMVYAQEFSLLLPSCTGVDIQKSCKNVRISRD